MNAPDTMRRLLRSTLFAALYFLSTEIRANEDTQPLDLLPLTEGLTLAQFGDRLAPQTMLVLDDNGQRLRGIDLSAHYGNHAPHPMEVIAGKDLREVAVQAGELPVVEVTYPDLLPMGRWSHENIAAGVNYKAHAEESEVDGGGFLFPKLAEATHSVAGLAVRDTDMLDYEVELAVTFDRDIARVEDLDAARAGFFVCIDYTERATLARLVDRHNVQSGKGFPEAKGFKGSFQTGPYMVVPHDWKAFLGQVHLRLSVNGGQRQKAAVSTMESPVPVLVAEALAHGTARKWSYYGRPISLMPFPHIAKGTTLLTGTPSGVVFAPPSTGFIVRSALHGVLTLGFLKGGMQRHVVERFIASEIAARKFLQPNDLVVAEGTYLGTITSRIHAANP